MSKSLRSRSSKIDDDAAADQLFLAPREQLAGRLVGHADHAVGRRHEHRVGHAAEHVGQVVLVDRRLAQLLAHALERRLQLAELVAPADFHRARVVALRDAIRALDQRRDRPMHAASGPPGEREAERERDERRGRRRAAATCAAGARCIESNCVRAAVESGRALARADLDLDFADGLRRDRCPATTRRSARTGTMALRVMSPLPPRPGGATRKISLPADIAQHDAQHRVVALEIFDFGDEQLAVALAARRPTTRSETWRASSPARSVSSPSTRLRESADGGVEQRRRAARGSRRP